MKWLFRLLLCLLCLLRLPSLAQPAGGDQGLYACVAQAIAHGGLPYRDAWDQKPPGIHYTYAAMFSVWHDEPVVAATDLLVAVTVSVLLLALGRRLSGRPGAGEVAALAFLLLGNPAFGRLGGIWLRAQCETFIALLISGALLLVLPFFPSEPDRRAEPPAGGVSPGRCITAGVLVGLAVLYKYNAAVYLLVAALAITLTAYLFPPQGSATSRFRASARRTLALATGFALPVVAAGLAFFATGAFNDLYQATIVYNLQYSGETYPGFWPFVRYLVTFPVQHASVDALWLVGGLGSAVLILAAAFRRPILVVVPAWVAGACLSIAVNGGRGLPQYFVQAAPALALAAGLSAAMAWRALGPAGRVLLLVIVGVAVARVAQFDKLAQTTMMDVKYVIGRVPANEYLGRFGGQRATDKFSALAGRELGDYLRAHTTSKDRVLIFGFSGNAYVRASRLSASRFFWSRPIIVGFNEGVPGYGAAGLLDDLRATKPGAVVLQRHDWPVEPSDSASYFLGRPELGRWLRSEYAVALETEMYQVWLRQPGGREAGPRQP
jgi:hypothetical protein